MMKESERGRLRVRTCQKNTLEAMSGFHCRVDPKEPIYLAEINRVRALGREWVHVIKARAVLATLDIFLCVVLHVHCMNKEKDRRRSAATKRFMERIALASERERGTVANNTTEFAIRY